VGPRRGGRGQLAPPDHQSEGAEAGEDEDEQPSKRKRGISKSPARMAFSCSSLSDITVAPLPSPFLLLCRRCCCSGMPTLLHRVCFLRHSFIQEWYQKPVLPIVSDSSLLDAISAETVPTKAFPYPHCEGLFLGLTINRAGRSIAIAGDEGPGRAVLQLLYRSHHCRLPVSVRVRGRSHRGTIYIYIYCRCSPLIVGHSTFLVAHF
jgi:hypothetical protein